MKTPTSPAQPAPPNTATVPSLHGAEEVRADIDRLLEAYFREQTARAAAVDAHYGRLWQAMQALSAAGGKRLRPYLTVLAYEIYGGRDYQGVLPVALAQELLHLALLIHDDIVDKDDVRRGVPNVSGQYRTIYGGYGLAEAELGHYAAGAALTAGDLLLGGAHAVILNSGLPPASKLVALELYGQTVFTVAGGQLLDMEAVCQPASQVDAFKIAGLKTAGYSFVSPLRVGASLAGASDTILSKLEQFGHSLGIAFQLQDDLQGVFGDPSQTGKSAISDLREGKRTYLIQQTYSLATAEQLAVFERSFGQSDLSAVQAGRLRDCIEACGARRAAERALRDYAGRALDMVGELQAGRLGEEALRRFIAKIIPRSV